MDVIAIGLLGSFFLLSAWLYEAFLSIKHGKYMDPKFTTIYVIGLVLLTYYSFLIGDIPFIALNGIILVISLLELDLSLRKKRAKRKP